VHSAGSRVTDRDREQRGPAREATRDGSRQLASLLRVFQGASPLAIGVAAAGIVAAVLLILSEFSSIASVDVASGSCEVINDSNPELAERCDLTGFERQPVVRTLLGLAIATMAIGAGLGGSRPAAVAMIVFGALVLGLGLLVDRPITDDTGAIGRNFEGATSEAGIGLTFEILAGALAAAAGALRLLARE
jgi:hypothetical protein